jgi:probable rRNA maturation factor
LGTENDQPSSGKTTAPLISVDINNEQLHVPLDEGRLRRAVQLVLEDAALPRAMISVAVVSDGTICELHRKYLHLDEPTDVLSFLLEHSDDYLEGEVIVSADTAGVTAGWYGWQFEDELLLYVIHGALHLVGYDDTTPESKAEMRAQEMRYLAHFGVQARYEESAAPPSDRRSPPRGPGPGGR